tara:strand:- start:399 stop:1709 length:1311 start_codon:yes stop_codon:yes gene_type:complete
MFDQLQKRLSEIFSSLSKKGKISEDNISDALRDVRRALLEADVNFKVAKSFISSVHQKAIGQDVLNSVTPSQQFVKIMKEELAEFLGGTSDNININKSGVTKILLVGLQGVGKTTTAVKLACFLKKERSLNCLLIAADRKRPAAIKQLQLLAQQNNISIFTGDNEDAISVVKNGLNQVDSTLVDVIIIDTAGRLHLDDELMEEIKQISNLSNPDEILFVADAMTGQDAINSSKAFSESLNISGNILTKMDADTRGGAAVSIREVTGKNIKFIGNGETVNDLEVFNPESMARRILGMGDVLSFVEKAKDLYDSDEAEKNHQKLIDGSFNLEDFQKQLKQFNKIGSMDKMMQMLPIKGIKKMGNVDDRQIVWMNAIINSMTIEEKQKPDIIDGSRRKRIAYGSGRSIFEVNQLLKQFFQIKKMMKKINKKGIFPFNFK